MRDKARGSALIEYSIALLVLVLSSASVLTLGLKNRESIVCSLKNGLGTALANFTPLSYWEGGCGVDESSTPAGNGGAGSGGEGDGGGEGGPGGWLL